MSSSMPADTEKLVGVDASVSELNAVCLDAAGKVIDAAFDSGFNDLSAFNKAFRAEFGVTPRAFARDKGSAR